MTNRLDNFFIKLRVVLFIPIVGLLTGCENNTISAFDEVKNQQAMDDLFHTAGSENASAMKSGLHGTITYYTCQIANFMQQTWWIGLIFAGIVAGLGLGLVKRDQRIRRTCTLIIPIISLIYVVLTFVISVIAQNLVNGV